MSLLKATRTAQFPLVAEFTWNFDDTMVNTAGNTVNFGSSNLGGAAGFFAVIPLPPNAVVIGGDVTIETAFDTAGYDITVGDTTTTNRYLATTDLKALSRTALVPTGFRGAGENVVLGFTSDDVCTTGKGTLRVQYIVQNRSNEVQVA